MNIILAASAAAVIAMPAAAQTVAPPPPATTIVPVAAPAPKPPLRRAAIHKTSPNVARVAAANRAAMQEPKAQAFVNAVQIYPFSDGAIYQVYTAPGAVTDIALQAGETLIAVAAGDTARWVIGDTTSGTGIEKRTHILVKPFASGLATNLVVTTDRRSYHLQLTATSRTAMAALSWTYPVDALIALRKANEQVAATAAPVAEGLAVDNLHFNYAISGDTPDWRPIRAFDDGRQTFVEFPASITVVEAPPLFIVGPTGEAELVNYRVRGRFYVVDRIFDAAELRLGTKKQEVVRITRVAEGAPSRKGNHLAQALPRLVDRRPVPLFGVASQSLRLLQCVGVERHAERRAPDNRPQVFWVRFVEIPTPIALDQVGLPRHCARLICDRFMCHRPP